MGDVAFPAIAVDQFPGILLRGFCVGGSRRVFHGGTGKISQYDLGVFHPWKGNTRYLLKKSNHRRRQSEDAPCGGSKFFFYIVVYLLALILIFYYGKVA